VNYDGSVIVDRSGHPLAAFARGEAVQIDPAAYFSGGLESMLSRLPQTNSESETVASIASTPEGPALLAVGNIAPTTQGLNLGGSEARFLVFWKYLSPEFVAGIGDKFVVKDLKLVPPAAARPGDVLVSDGAGKTLGALQWLDRRPGDHALTAVLPKAYLMLSLLIAVMLAIALVSWRQFAIIAQRERQARHDAKHDRLTGLPNRNALMEALDRLLAKPGTSVCATFIDLDGFKEVNDTYDHETGDRLINAVAAGFRVLAEDGGFVCRLGGDEFVILLHGAASVERAQRLAARVIAFLASPFNLEGRMALVGGSIGIAAAEAGTMTSGELMRRADIAMYEAKSGGKNRYCVFHPGMDAERNETMAILAELRAILDRGGIAVAYQPIVDAASMTIAGVEALARWPADSQRQVGPDAFIPIAESAGLINKLGEAVLARACADAKQWPDIRISVNVSPVQFRDPDFVTQCLAIIDDSGIARGRIEMEVTEGTLIDDVCRLQPVFESLRKAGLSIALDDFGSGYSSIAYLRDLTFDRIKIDRSLTQSLLTSSMARNVIQATGLIANGISAAVTAEGVESSEELQLLRLAGCSEFQGYFFGRPQTAEAITAAIAGEERLSTAA